MNQGSLLVTGASTGIGRSCAIAAARRGFRVFAGIRKQTDAESLLAEGLANLTPVRLDVTDQESIQKAVEELEETHQQGTFTLVNNAGLYVAGPLELQPLSDAESLFQVNVLGLLAVTRAFLPLLRKTRGHIINISSISGRVALPGVSYYAASKFAVEAITDSLRVELAPFGVRCTAIEPGNITTPIWDKVNELDQREEAQGTEDLRELYAPLLRFIRQYNQSEQGIPPERVAETLLQVLESSSPPARILVGQDAKTTARLRWLPTRLRDWLLLRFFRA